MAHDTIDDIRHRRRFLRMCGSAAIVTGGGALLAACGGSSSPTPSPSATPSSALQPPPPLQPGPTYTAVDADRLNFALQVHYLLAAYLFRGVSGSALPATLTTGTGTAGTVTGGAQVSFATPALAEMMREMRNNVQAHITFLRRTLGNTATAQPAISIAGGASGPFQAIASTQAFPASAPFDPYASDTNYLLGALALIGPINSGMIDLARLVGDRTLQDGLQGVMSAGAYHDSVVRFELFVRARAETLLVPPVRTLFIRVGQMAGARDALDGPTRFETDIGNENDFLFAAVDDANNGSRRSPEQVLNIFFANRTSVTSGAFFPNGINGVIRASGSSAA